MITQETNPVYWAFTHCGTLEPWTVIFFNFHFGSTILKIEYSKKLELSFQTIDFEITFIRTK